MRINKEGKALVKYRSFRTTPLIETNLERISRAEDRSVSWLIRKYLTQAITKETSNET